MKNLAIIPARSGSKGLKDKNIKEMHGKPLMVYTLEAAVKSGIFDEIMVSTDSEQYAEIARTVEGVTVPFLRSDDNASDVSSTWDVVREVLKKYEQKNEIFDMFCILQPTSPLRTYKHIREAYDLYVEKSANSIVSVCELGHSINTINTLPRDHSLVGFIRNESISRRQLDETYYRLNGSIYMCNTKEFLEYGTIYKEKSYAYIMDTISSIDIDDENDFVFAEFLLN